MRTARVVLTSIVVAATITHSVHAQSAQPFSIQGSLLYSGLSGKAYDNFDPGVGFEVQGRYTTAFGLSIGIGFQHTSHHVLGADGGSLAGPFVEPRYAFEIKGVNRIYPYVSVRASALKQSISGPDFETTASGFTANAGGGVLFGLSERVNVDVGATFGLTNFSHFVLIDAATGRQVTGNTGSGSNFVVRTGLAVGLF